MSLILLINSAGYFCAAFLALYVAFVFKKKGKDIDKPFFILSAVFFLWFLLDLFWFVGIIQPESADIKIIAPFINLVVLGCWFYVGLYLSGDRNTYYLIPITIMALNAILIFSKMDFLVDMIVGLSLLWIFFHLGLLKTKISKKSSYTGIVYGASFILIAIFGYLQGVDSIRLPWFLPTIAVSFLIFDFSKDDVEIMAEKYHKSPLVFEIFKFGFFIVGLCVFLMLGTLGVHEMGHTLAARVFGCSYSTEFHISSAITKVQCPSSSGSTIISAAGLIFSLFVSFLMYFAGNDFSKRISFLLFAFSILISINDLGVLGLSGSVFVSGIFVSALLLGVGLLKIIRQYEKEYAAELEY